MISNDKDDEWSWATTGTHLDTLKTLLVDLKSAIGKADVVSTLTMHTDKEIRESWGDQIIESLDALPPLVDSPTEFLSSQYTKMMQMQRVNTS